MRLKKLAALVLAGALCLTSFVGCGVNPDETAATLGDQKVSAGVVNFICKYQKATIDDTYVSYFGEDFWDQDLYGYGTTMEEDLKDSVMDAIHDLCTLKAHMADYKVEITAEEEAAIKEAVLAFLAANTQEALEELGATEEIVTEALTLYTIQAKMYDAIIEETNRNVSDEEANMRGITLVQMGIEGEYNDEGTYVKYTEKQIESIKETANKILAESASVGLAKAAENNKYKAEDTAYNKKDSNIEAALLNALNALKVGETSKVIETKTALYIATIDEEVDAKATEENREAIIVERENALYDGKLTTWQKEDGWTVNDSVLEKIDFHNLLTQKVESTEKEDSTESK